MSEMIITKKKDVISSLIIIIAWFTWLVIFEKYHLVVALGLSFVITAAIKMLFED